MAQGIEPATAEGAPRLQLMPFPRSISLRGAPFRPTPSSYLYVSGNATPSARRKCQILSQQFQELGFRTTLATVPGLGPTQALLTASATFIKMPQIERPLRGEVGSPEGYRLTITGEGALLHGADEQGLLYAGITLKQLIEDGPQVPGMEIEDSPLLPRRVMHLDFKGWPPTPAHLKNVLVMLADLKINTLVLEYEAYFDYPSQPGLSSEGALTPDVLAEIELLAEDLGVTLVPLVQCLGNAGHMLRRSGYAELREHPDYLQVLCPVNPATLDVVTAMMEDLVAVHRGKYFHIGGDEVRLLGSNPLSDARARQLGGRAALYLEHVGKISRYLISRGKQPLIWDDMFRKMSDEQVKWLPPEVCLASCQYEGQGGRATPAILTHLDRYKRLGRRVWGAATRSPSARYDSFDNVDAWTEAAELGYLEGLMLTAWTRDHTQGPLYAPADISWPAAFYAAERMWSSRKGPTREQFPDRFIMRLFGIKDASQQNRLWAGFDLLMREHPRRARDFFAHDAKHAVRNRELLQLLDSWASLGALREYVDQFDEVLCANYANLSAGKGDPFHSGRLRWRVSDVKKKAPLLARAFNQQAARLTHPSIINEFLDSQVAYYLKRLDEMEALLSSYPLPSADWQQPANL